ncbi:unnamed protein product [Rhodiola kirilowii]
MSTLSVPSSIPSVAEDVEQLRRDALLTSEATKRWTSSNQVLMEVACTRTSDHLMAAKKAYHARYKKSLEEDVGYHKVAKQYEG